MRSPTSTTMMHTQLGRLAGLLDELDVGLVSVDSADDFANVNRTAAVLLGMTPGNATATEFYVALETIAARAINRTEIEAEELLHSRDHSAESRSTWLFADPPTHLGVVCKPAPFTGFVGRIWAFYDNSRIAGAIDAASQANALVKATSDAMLDPQVLFEGVWRDGRIVDLIYRDVNPATTEYLGLTRDELVGHSILDSLPNIESTGLLDYYIRCAETGRPLVLDGFPYYNEVLDDLRYYDVRAAQVRPGLISLTWRDVSYRIEFGQRIAASEERFRLLAENVADVVVHLDDDGTIRWISNSVEQALGAPPDYWVGRPGTDFVLPEEHLRGPGDSGKNHIGRRQITGADGCLHWIHLHSKPFYDSEGNPDGVVASFRVIDEEVAAETRAAEQIARREAQNRSLAARLQLQTDRLTKELESATRYVASILPRDLDGPVPVAVRHEPSRELAGDCYDFRWIDEDHLLVYLIDVSGHGVEPAMVSVSVHNVLRSGTLTWETMLAPHAVLAELNRLFQMDQQGGNYFTIWYGVYQRSTRTLRYATAGHPPALALSGGATHRLSTDGIPIGVLEDAEFQTASYPVPPGQNLLIYSDGAFEFELPDGRQWSLPEFADLCSATATGSPDWTLDALVDRLRARSASGLFDDDCTLIRVSFA